MNKDLPYFIALASAPGIGPVRFKVLLKHFGTASNVWKAPDRILVKILTPNLFKEFINYRKSFDVEGYFNSIIKQEIKVLTILDKNYPQNLKEIIDAPPIFYYKGEIKEEDKLAMAVVGTRKMTSYGREVTEILVKDLVAAGFTIVSGLARGVDATAHKAALEAGGRTIAVLGGGLNMIYPSENEKLAIEISQGRGAVVSEFAPDSPSVPGNFPVRNRIISGLSLGILVTEAAADSGSLITAGHAGEQGREVFAVPGPIYSKLTKGPAELIKQGAKLVLSVSDILEELNLESRARYHISEIKADNREEQIILDILKDGPLHLDEITRASKLATASVGSLLSLLEIKGIIKSLGSGSYSLKN